MQIVNSWKVDMFPVSADTAKQEFDRIYKENGEITPQAVVDASRNEGAALHSCFEWDDAKAAEGYRRHQAGNMIRCLVTTVIQDGDNEPVQVRAVVKTTERYEPITVTFRSPEKTAVLLQDALNDIRRFKAKHGALKQLAGVFAAMDEFETSMVAWEG